MKTKLLDQDGERTFVLIFDKGEEFIDGLTSFARENDLGGGHFTAIGAFRDVMLGYFQPETNSYRQIPVVEQVEVLSLAGDIALKENMPDVHAHVVVGKPDGTAHGGHVIEAHIWPTLEVILIESPKHLRRRVDPETGLALIDLDASS